MIRPGEPWFNQSTMVDSYVVVPWKINHGSTFHVQQWFDYHGSIMVHLPWYSRCYTMVNESEYNLGSQHQHNINRCLSPQVVVIYGRIVTYEVTCTPYSK